MDILAAIDIKDGKPVGFKIPVTKKFAEQDVYKSLCKYALSLTPDDKILREFKDIIDWIKSKKDITNLPIVKVLNSYIFFPDRPKLNLYTRKTSNEDLPLMFAEFQYKNFVMVSQICSFVIYL